MGVKEDPRFVNRYHGSDSIGYDSDGDMVETEFKGVAGNSTAISTRKDKKPQLTREGNKKRSKNFVRKKKKKIGKKSNRIGGPYTQDELSLHKQIKRNDGEKQMLSTHTNVKTGDVQIIKRNADGEIIEKADTINIYS